MRQKLVNGEWVDARQRSESTQRMATLPLVSENLGFGVHDLKKRLAEKQAHGLSGVEFKPDPLVPQYYNVHFSGPAERIRYEKMRGLSNMSGENGAGKVLSPRDIERAREQVVRAYPVD